MADWLNKTHVGDCRVLLRTMADAGVRAQCVVTSPPYWGLRDYGVAGAIGLEPTLQEWVATIYEVMQAVRLVLGATAHPTQKPTGLMTWAVQKAKATGTVLDPYMGSGTTGVACAALGLPFIGIEIEPRYFETAIDRIGVAHANGRLFA